ncbi:MAG: DMT family transporter [Myxococcales bacterium]|nr:DMT family transporter [Myxococcales bacterium]
MVLAALCWSTAGILIRLVDADPWAIVAWRSAIMAIAVTIGILSVQMRRTGSLSAGIGAAVTRFRDMGWAGVLSASLLATTFGLFVLAITRTSVGSTLVIMAATPFVVALLGWAFLGERPSRRTWMAMTVVLAGIAIMFGDGLGSGAWSGNLLALVVTVTFGVNTLVVRRHREVDMVPAVALGGFLSAIAAAPLAESLAVDAGSFAALALLGIVQLSIGLALFVAAVKRLTAADVSLIGTLETVLGPVWAWLGVGERPEPAVLVGGALVLGTLMLYTRSTRIGPAVTPAEA